MVWIWSGPFGRGDEWMNGWNCGDWGSPKVGCKQDEGQFGGPSGMIGANLVRQAMERMSPGVSVTAKPTNGEGPNWPFLVRHQNFWVQNGHFWLSWWTDSVCLTDTKCGQLGGGGERGQIARKLGLIVTNVTDWDGSFGLDRPKLHCWSDDHAVQVQNFILVQDIKDPHFLMEHQHQPKDLLEGIKEAVQRNDQKSLQKRSFCWEKIKQLFSLRSLITSNGSDHPPLSSASLSSVCSAVVLPSATLRPPPQIFPPFWSASSRPVGAVRTVSVLDDLTSKWSEQLIGPLTIDRITDFVQEKEEVDQGEQEPEKEVQETVHDGEVKVGKNDEMEQYQHQERELGRRRLALIMKNNRRWGREADWCTEASE